MDKTAILTKAVEKAIAGGWIDGKAALAEIKAKPDFALGIIIPAIIFNHDFAKALWGEKQVIFTQLDFREGKTLGDNALPRYLYHLQQMVVADDKIKYLGEHLDERPDTRL